jgi:class 3 adenylate cyclase/DNA-binding NarL/FixJ family response regulator
MKQSVIICVDDEQIVLDGLKAELKRSLGNDHIIEISDSGQDALEVIEEFIEDGYEVPLIISDYIMPHMKGDELLTEIHSKYPNTLKIMLTGQANTEGVTNAVNNANLYRFISKPWNSSDLKMTITEAVKSYFKDKEIIKVNTELRQRNEEITDINKNLEKIVDERTADLQKISKDLEVNNQQLTVEKSKFEELLLNILPQQIAERLKNGETLISDNFDNVGIMFVDIVDFTSFSAGASPQKIVECLNEIFTLFDQVSDKYGVLKIKTIGDCYMATTGLPIAREDSVVAAAQWALNISEKVQNYTTKNGINMKFRIGMDCGTVVAGVIGKKKFIYDLWGDAVNTASRMADHGVSGKVHTTERFIKSIDKYYKEHPTVNGGNIFTYQERDEIKVKGKGIMKTYLLNLKDNKI